MEHCRFCGDVVPPDDDETMYSGICDSCARKGLVPGEGEDRLNWARLRLLAFPEIMDLRRNRTGG